MHTVAHNKPPNLAGTRTFRLRQGPVLFLSPSSVFIISMHRLDDDFSLLSPSLVQDRSITTTYIHDVLHPKGSHPV